MKFSYIALIFVFLLGHMQVTFASESESLSASPQVEHGCCMSDMPHQKMTSEHDCCQHTAAADMHCPSCGDDCSCGHSCHFTMHSVGIVSLVDAASFHPVVASFVQPGSSMLVSADLSNEKRPPKFS